MPIPQLSIGTKTANQGVNASGKLTAAEFNELVARVNDLITANNSKVYITQDEYDALVAGNAINPNVEYNIYEE